MGREIRMVPPNWEHPKVDRFRFTPGKGYGTKSEFQPMHDKNFAAASLTWKQDFAEWESGKRPEYCTDESAKLEFWEWNGGPPERAYYRPWMDEEATWFQLWETVSEGTPVSPPFATRQELADYLAENGDFWDQSRGTRGWGKAAADSFVAAGWAPTLATQDGVVVESKDFNLKFNGQA